MASSAFVKHLDPLRDHLPGSGIAAYQLNRQAWLKDIERKQKKQYR